MASLACLDRWIFNLRVTAQRYKGQGYEGHFFALPAADHAVSAEPLDSAVPPLSDITPPPTITTTMLPSVMAWLLSSSSRKPIARSTTITTRELVALVTTRATAFIFCPKPLRQFRDVGVVLFLAWFAHILHDVWESVPAWLMGIVNHARAGNENLHDQDAVWGTI
jgi:membrane-bound metal-dependent hydrolase YbcI (DUF457 family)